jgi:TfoX/Sxy family transcriptional regulator of competence genes
MDGEAILEQRRILAQGSGAGPWAPLEVQHRLAFTDDLVRSAPSAGQLKRVAQRGHRRRLFHHDALMAYDEDLANRIRELIAGEPDATEKRMFGGLAFLIGGHMSVAASGQGGLMVRVDPDETDALVAKPHAAPFVMRGREMKGWLRVDDEGVRTRRQLAPWVKRGVAYARSLPPKG